jgi:hypothetical protein
MLLTPHGGAPLYLERLMPLFKAMDFPRDGQLLYTTLHFNLDAQNPDFNSPSQLPDNAPIHSGPAPTQFIAFKCAIVFLKPWLSTKLRHLAFSPIISPNLKVPRMRYIEAHNAGTITGSIHINNRRLDLIWRVWGNASFGTGSGETCSRGGSAVCSPATRGCAPCLKRASCNNTISDASSRAAARAHADAGA